MEIIYRKALPDDAPECIALRGRTRENSFSVEQLKEVGVTLDSWQSGIKDGSFCGYVGVTARGLVGYCFGDRSRGEIVVLALLPEYEGKGIGKTLLNLVIEEFKGLGFKRLFLGCSPDPRVRSYGFYRYLGWKPTGTMNSADDEILEYDLS